MLSFQKSEMQTSLKLPEKMIASMKMTAKMFTPGGS
jgi:hypothetical protein